MPQGLETNRSEVSDPDSVGIHLRGLDEAELLVVLYRGGWADIDYIAGADDAGVIFSPAVNSTQAFASLLDACITRVFGISCNAE